MQKYKLFYPHQLKHEFIILTSDSLSIWGKQSITNLLIKDNEFSEKYRVKLIRLPAFLAKGNKNNIWIRGLIKKVLEIKPFVFRLFI